MDQERYETDENYRRRIEGARKGGRSRSEAKVTAARVNVAKSPGRPRKHPVKVKYRRMGELEAQDETTRKLRLMSALGWPLLWECRWTQARIEEGTLRDEENKTAAWMEWEGGPDARRAYEGWRDIESKNLYWWRIARNPVTDQVLRILCRYRLRMAGRGTATVGDFAI